MSDQKNRLAGKAAIVTGAGRGIGRAEALLLAQQGAAVVVADIGQDEAGQPLADAVVREITAAGGRAVAAREDISTFDGARRTVEAAVASFGRLDIVVNNAGSRGANPVDELSEEQWDSVIASHLKGTFAMTRFAVPHLRKQGGGVILNTGSEAGLGMICNSAYAAAKEGIAGFTRSVAREQGRYGIRCNLVRPSANTNTGGGDWSKSVFRQWLDLNRALGRFAVGERGKSSNATLTLPEQVAVMVVWLCTDAAANINGRSFFARGEEVGLWSEPELVRHMIRPGSWTLDSLDEYAPAAMTGQLENHFLVKV
ncbi:MAG: SDR family NAD(P)-dependent oxidoreductase [Burkholderiaceae bacterium]|nr:SDR family NAD(P)-dependent oxidoreductase [Burkholderiaceae bacterium]